MIPNRFLVEALVAAGKLKPKPPEPLWVEEQEARLLGTWHELYSGRPWPRPETEFSATARRALGIEDESP